MQQGIYIYNNNYVHGLICFFLTLYITLTIFLAICSRGCGNGRCIGPGRCSCKSGWSGTTCQTRKCEENNLMLCDVVVGKTDPLRCV